MSAAVLTETRPAGGGGAIASTVRIITLNRPDRMNAITPDLLRELNLALIEADRDEAVGAIVLTGAGRAFCAGDDLLEQQDMDLEDEAVLAEFCKDLQDVTRSIMFNETPVIAAVHGWAVGGAFSWPMNCDLSVWGEGARGFFPELSYGIFVSGGVTGLLPRIAGPAKANEMMYLSRKYSAADLSDCGVAWKVVPDDTVLDEALAVASYIADLPAVARAAMKTCTSEATRAEMEAVLDREAQAVADTIRDPAWKTRIGKNFQKSG